MRTEVAERAAELREQELVAEVVKPAQAEAEETKSSPSPRQRRSRSWRGSGLEQPGGVGPDADRAAAGDRQVGGGGIGGANVTVLNGADGLGDVAAGLVGQGLAIFDSLRSGLDGNRLDDAEQQAGADRTFGRLTDLSPLVSRLGVSRSSRPVRCQGVALRGVRRHRPCVHRAGRRDVWTPRGRSLRRR